DDITASQIDIGNALTELAARMAKGVPQADGSVKPEPLMDVKHVGDAVLRMDALQPAQSLLRPLRRFALFGLELGERRLHLAELSAQVALHLPACLLVK